MNIGKQIRDILIKYSDAETVEKWMNTPNPALGMSTPQQCIDSGNGIAIIQMIEDALAGSSMCC